MGLVKKLRTSVIAILVCSMAAVATAQENPDAKTTANGPRKQMATIIFAGLAGAVLGLSTLSFYGRPQDRLSNIAVGFAIGVIGGTIYVTYGAATRPQEFYSGGPGGNSIDQLKSISRQALLESSINETNRLSLKLSF